MKAINERFDKINNYLETKKWGCIVGPTVHLLYWGSIVAIIALFMKMIASQMTFEEVQQFYEVKPRVLSWYMFAGVLIISVPLAFINDTITKLSVGKKKSPKEACPE